MCVWTKKRGSMNAVVLMATPCPKSLLHGKGEKWIARNMLQGLDSRQPMTAMTEKKSPGQGCYTVAISTAPDVLHNHTCTHSHSITHG